MSYPAPVAMNSRSPNRRTVPKGRVWTEDAIRKYGGIRVRHALPLPGAPTVGVLTQGVYHRQ